jgi:hypothetical protein
MLLNLTQFTPDALMHLRTYHRQTKIILKFPFEVKLKSTTFIKMFLGSGGGGERCLMIGKLVLGPNIFPHWGIVPFFFLE